jgi:hypothetical protein
MGSQALGDLQGILKLITHYREADKIGGECFNILPDPRDIEWVAEVFVDVEESSDVPVLSQNS